VDDRALRHCLAEGGSAEGAISLFRGRGIRPGYLAAFE
jgi:hypothetical protein